MAHRRPSTTSSDSFEIVSPSSVISYTRVTDDLSSDDEDQIVWGIDSISSLRSPLSDEDFILLHGPLSPQSAPEDTRHINSITVTRYRIDGPSVVIEESSTRAPSPAPSSDTDPTPPSSPPPRSRRRNRPKPTPRSPPPIIKTPTPKKTKQKDEKKSGSHLLPISPTDSPNGLGARSIVDDMSEHGDDPAAMLYEEAVRYINCFLSDPMENKAAHLALLQALIIELGFFTALSKDPTSPRAVSPTPSTASSFDISNLPHSMRAAKSFIKANVFLNVREYIAVRAQGQEALQSVLLPSRRALVTQLRKKRSRVPRDWVKERGLNVFLVSCH